jgi:hypothetical protein
LCIRFYKNILPRALCWAPSKDNERSVEAAPEREKQTNRLYCFYSNHIGGATA